MADTPLCSGCHKAGKLCCARCYAAGVEAFYCSEEHQKALWPTHKRFCGKADPAFQPELSKHELSFFTDHYRREKSQGSFSLANHLQNLGEEKKLYIRTSNLLAVIERGVATPFDAGPSFQPFMTSTWWLDFPLKSLVPSSDFYKAILNHSTMVDNAARRNGDLLEKPQLESLLGRIDLEARRMDRGVGSEEASKRFRAKLAKMPTILKMGSK